MNLPVLSEYILTNEYKFVFYKHLESVFLENGNLKESIKNELAFWSGFKKSFRTQVFLNGADYLLGIDFDNKVLRLASVRLSNETFVLDQFEANVDSKDYKAVENDETYLAFKSHVTNILKTHLEDHPGISNIVTKREDLEDLSEYNTVEFKSEIESLTNSLLGNLNEYSPSLFEKISDFALGLTARYALLRVHLLKFLAILPSLDHDKSGSEVKRILLESLRRLITDSKRANKLGLKGDQSALPVGWIVVFYFSYLLFSIFPAGMLASLIRFKVRFMAKRFIAGETIETSQGCFKEVFQTGRDLTLDQLGELVVSEKEADNYKNEVLNLVRGFSEHINKGEKNIAGILKAHVSIKVSALCSDFKPEAFDYTYSLVAPRLIEILTEAKKNSVFINIDAEHYHYRDIVFKIYEKVLLETDELKDYDQTGIVIQAYLRDCAGHLKEVIELAKKRNMTMPVRLVKGAYWDAETIEARAHGHDAPQFLNKEETDIHFRQMIVEIFKSYPHLKLCIASHNYSDHAFSEVLRKRHFSNLPEIEHQCLHMTYEALSMAMAKMGWATRNYVPIGSLIVGMAYLVRRIMENSSQVGVLTIMRSHKKKAKLLGPEEVLEKNTKEGNLAFDETISQINGDFSNIPILRTYLDHELDTMVDSLKSYSLGNEFNNEFKPTGEMIEIKTPSDLETTVGKITFASVEDADRACEVIEKEFYEGQWSNFTLAQKSAIFLKASSLMLARRNELSALIMHESGKALNEALADVDEAIDFINFYIREQRNIQAKSDVAPRGPSVIIAPWNFPLAIPCGMAVSALIAGNTAILKSAEQTPLIAQALVDLLHEAGIPKEALIHLPGIGETVGQKLIEDSRVSSIIFTGSKAVGVHIYNTASGRLYTNKKTGKKYPVKIITEMGGKNAVIVTNNAELDETVAGILYSAFAHAGQKCSACSRVLVDNQIKDKLIARLKEAASDIKVGVSTDFSSYINPLINGEEKSRLISQVEQACAEATEFDGRVVINRSKEELPGSCVGPTIIELPTKRAFSSESFSQRELFAPVVHIIGFNDLDEAIEIFNSTNYALTGGVFAQSQDDIDYCLDRLQSGNIYINRTITGARVGIEPFGGFKMSGTGPKAGGVDYLKSLNVIGIDNESEKTIIEDGSEYKVGLARKSGLPLEGRVERVSKALDLIISNFGPLFPGVFGRDKEKLHELRKFLTTKFINVKLKNRDNRYIPGQLSYSKFDQSVKTTVFMCFNERPTLDVFINFIFSLTSGAGTTVICTNQKAYIWWSYLIDIFLKNGISKRNVECYYSNLNQLDILNNENIDVLVVDGHEDHVNSSIELINNSKSRGVMTKIITPFESVELSGLTDYLKVYSYERAFAINTMRHGAPMELEY